MDIRAFTSGLPNAICMTDLALKPKNHPTSGLVKAWYCKKICNAATIPLQICNGIVAVFQNKITIFYSPLYICHFLSLHLVSSSLSLSLSLSPEHSQSSKKVNIDDGNMLEKSLWGFCMAWFMGFDRAVEIEWVVTELVWIQIGWFGGGVVIDDGGVMGGEGVGLLIWV